MGFFTGSDSSVKTKTIKDPMKESVASPLSSFLSSKIGTGLDRYPGELTAPLDQDTLNRYGEYMSMNPTEFYSENVVKPTMQIARDEMLPEVREGYAGSLRGSGRYRGEEDYISNITQKLGVEMAERVPAMYESQIKTGMSMQQLRDVQNQREYQDWYKSLPENNPVLTQGLQFLSEGISTGSTTFSYLDPGQKGAFWDLLDIGAMVGSAALMGGTAAATGGTSLLAGAAMGTMLSSMELKDNIKPNEIDSLEVIDSVSIVNFKYKPEAKVDTRDRIGVIAELVPDIIATEDHKALDTVNIIGVLLDAVQKLNRRVVELEGRQ